MCGKLHTRVLPGGSHWSVRPSGHTRHRRVHAALVPTRHHSRARVETEWVRMTEQYFTTNTTRTIT